MFEFMNPLRDAGGRISRMHAAARLEDDITVIILLIYIMNGDTRTMSLRIHDGLVDEVAIHALSSKPGKQRRMYIDDLPRIGLDECVGDLPKKTGQHDELDSIFLQQGQIGIAAEELFSLDQETGDAFFGGYRQHAGSRTIASDESDADLTGIPEPVDDLLSVGACSGGEDGDLFHGLKIAGIIW